MAAAVVSHAMRRFSTSSPENGYGYGLRVADSPEDSSSSLSRSMRYADPWLYGTVRTPPGLVLTPAIALCECADYQNGTKRSSKKTSASTCKKCKGTRLPLAKFGTMRCYPSSPAVVTTPRAAGTMRVATHASRASILPAVDPYDLMRRSRLAMSKQQQQTDVPKSTSSSTSTSNNRTRSQSPRKALHGRKSILECDINPYELMSAEKQDSGVTLVSGQRIRVRPNEETHIPIKSKTNSTLSTTSTLREKSVKERSKMMVPSTITRENKEPFECNGRFKSILKKPTATFGDTDNNAGVETSSASPIAAVKSGSNLASSTSHFYLPMPMSGTHSTPIRKKVQFAVENNNDTTKRRSCNRNGDEAYSNLVPEEVLIGHCRKKEKATVDEIEIQEECLVEEPIKHNSINSAPMNPTELLEPSPKVQFTDSMRNGNSFADQDLERLDGLTSKTRRKSPTSSRPNEPPPPPPIPPPEIPQIHEILHFTPETPLQILSEAIHVSPETPQIHTETHLQNPSSSEDIEEPEPVATKINVEQPANVEKIEDDVFTDDVSHDIYEDIDANVAKTIEEASPPSVPPRKRSSHKQPCFNLTIATPPITHTYTESNKTVVQIVTTPPVHKIQIKNEFPETVNIQTVSVSDSPQRKTSIMITGDDCYSTVNVNDDIPLYQSSVVVKDCSDEHSTYKQSSSVYITASPLLEVKEEAPESILKDPVEAIKRNLVPHVCGRSDVESRRNNKNVILDVDTDESLINLGTYEHVNDDVSSEHSSSTQYELMDASSDCYTDNSNRSSVTEEELASRTKFYELLADSALAEVSENEDHHYESIRLRTDPIYEEIEIPPPLPKNPPPTSLMDDLQLDKEYTTRSIFEGASKYDILSYLVDAKERGIVQEDSYNFNFLTNSISGDDDSTKGSYNRASHMSDSSEDSSLVISGALIDDKFPKNADIERNDSGVGSETSKSSLSKYRSRVETSIACEDCEQLVDSYSDTEPLICRKCAKKRSERKEIIAEIVETEEKYSRDLQIILEEFYQPMLVAGLLTPEQLSAIFLNVEELLENSQALAERLRDAVEIASEQGDEDLQTVNMGKLFMEAAPMLHAFETYCVRQGGASLLLAGLEKEKELLRIFLRVSQMENALLRRMNLNSFLMVPVQRVTKYPLLLARLYKVTPTHHETKEQLKEAQHKIELHLNHMNSQTKDVPSKLWRRIGSSSGRRPSTEMDLVNIKLRKIAVDVLEWNHDEAKFALEGKLLFTQPTDNNWRKGRTIKLTPINALLVINGKQHHGSNKSERSDENGLIFSRHSMAREAALLLVRDKNGRYSLLREPLFLDRCIIAADPAWQSYFEVQELLGKDTFIFKAEDEQQTKTWYSQLQYHAQGMGAWRKRRNALANIMINGMGLRS